MVLQRAADLLKVILYIVEFVPRFKVSMKASADRDLVLGLHPVAEVAHAFYSERRRSVRDR